MKKLIAALSILSFLVVGIFGGIFLNQSIFSGLLCFFGWSPACIFLGVAIAGLNLRVYVEPKQAAAIPKATESAEQIRKRVSRIQE